MRLPQGISHENNPLDQRVVLSCVTPEHDEPTFQIKSEVEGDIAVQDGNNVCETPNADSSYEDHLKIETGYSNLQGNVSYQGVLFPKPQSHDDIYEE